MRLFCVLSVSLAVVWVPFGATFANPVSAGRDLAATCANCHGTNGNTAGGMAQLAGMPRDYIVTSLAAFKKGERPATIMHQLSKGYTDAQVGMIADYFASQKPKSK